MELVVRYLTEHDYDAGRSANLLVWCHARGADEFTLSLIGVRSPDAAILDSQFEAFFSPFARPRARRRRLSAVSEKELVREAELWALTEESLARLTALLHEGLFTYDSHLDLWPEDLVVYRRGEFMLGVVTHEGGGVIRVTEPELLELGALGFPCHESVPWVQY